MVLACYLRLFSSPNTWPRLACSRFLLSCCSTRSRALTHSHVMSNTSNGTSAFRPSPQDLIFAVPRAITRVGSYALVSIPERIDNLFKLRGGGTVIAEATGNGARNASSSSAPVSWMDATKGATAAIAGGAAAAQDAPQSPVGGQPWRFQQLRNFGGVFSYMFSKWALACFSLVSGLLFVFSVHLPSLRESRGVCI